MDKNNGGKDMLKDLFKKKEALVVDVTTTTLEISIEDAQTLSDYVYNTLMDLESKSKKKMDFEKFYTKKIPIKVALAQGKLQIIEDLSKVYVDRRNSYVYTKRIYLNVMLNYYMSKFYKLCDLNSMLLTWDLILKNQMNN